MKMSLLTKVYNGYTIEQLVEAANKLGLSVPETNDQLQALADDIKSKREYQVILDVYDGFEAEETPERSETERVVHAFMADLVGTRNAMQAERRNELVRSFCEVAFNKLMEDVTKNPFSIRYVATITKSEFDQYDQIYALTLVEGQYKLARKITELVSDLGIKEVKLDIDSKDTMIIVDFI